MTLYFDSRVKNPEIASISTFAVWHPNLPFLAVASYSQDKGGFITIYDDQGEAVPDVESPGHSVAQVTAICWHPERRRLIAGWESGELRMWSGDTGSNEFNVVVTPHRDPITILQWSQHGNRLVSADTAGSIIGWKIDTRGQLLMMFHHELHDYFVHIAFKIVPPKAALDISGLAKAAVAGDERALDSFFSSWRPRTAAPTASTSGQRDNPAFYAASSRGIVFFVDVEGQCVDVLDTNGAAILSLLHHQTRDSLVVMSAGYNIGYFQAEPNNGKLVEITKVKLSGKGDLSRSGPAMCWVDINTLAILTGELAIRCWDLHSGDTYVLSPPESPIDNDTAVAAAATTTTSPQQQVCTSLSFCKNNETLAAGTNLGKIYLWKRKPPVSESSEQLLSWPQYPESCSVHGTVKQLTWGAVFLRNPLLAVNCITNVFILHQQPMCAASNDGVSAYQMSPTRIFIECDDRNHTLKTDIQAQLVAVNRDYVAVSSGRIVAVYRIQRENAAAAAALNSTVVTNFKCDTEKILIRESVLIVLTPLAIQLRSVEGSVIQTLASLPEEGEPITMELSNRYLTVGSLNGILKIWDLEKREAKLHARVTSLTEMIEDFAEIIEARSNSDCRFVSITIAMSNLMPSSVFYVWEIENDKLHEFDFAASNEGDDNTLVSKCRGRLVTAHCWDNDDPRLLVCQARKVEARNANSCESSRDEEIESSVVLVSMFATSEQGIVLQDVRAMSDPNCRLLSVESPSITILNSKTSANAGSEVKRMLMRDFEELGSCCDPATKAAILDFCYHLSIANMDEAFKAIKTIKNEAVWKSLARMCVKTKQLDMAMLCLGRMKQARSARALREAMQDQSLSLEAKVGVLAVELELYKDAERLFREAKRLDLVGSLFEARNKFKEAVDFAGSENKIGEKTCYYNYAKALESEGKITEAIEMYGKADCHRFEVPRMLLMAPRELENYLKNADDPEIIKWHAQYVESTGDLEGALKLYEKARDTLSMTRLLCFLAREEEACDIVTKNNHAASAYHLAAHYDAKNNVPQAIHFYTSAKAYTNAIRMCKAFFINFLSELHEKENDMLDDLWPLATLAPQPLQIDVAKYYEANEQSDRAILLYHKAGMLRKALDLAFKTRQFNALQLIAMDVNADSDPALIEKCAEYFVENEQIEKAVDLLALGKKYLEALRLMQEHNVALSEDLAEKMTIDKVEKDLERERVRISTLEKIGEIALEQGNYHLATKKFTQAGNKSRAMKALLKSGDTEKICFFAQVSRQREIYVMAANYLQTLDWQNQPEVLRSITTFYSKGKAMDLLANFYVNCADVEIDDYRNYEKAVEALNQASKCLGKVSEPKDLDIHRKAIIMVNGRISTIKRYLEIKKFFDKGETDVAMSHVRHLLDLQNDELEKAVRIGDLFTTVSQHYVRIGEMEKAQKSVEELRRLVPGINLSYHYSPELLETLGYKMNIQRENTSDNEDGIEEFLGD